MTHKTRRRVVNAALVLSLIAVVIGLANAQNYPSYAANDAAHPAPRGSTIIVYGTGQGATNNQSTGLPGNPGSGNAAPGSPLYVAQNGATATVGGVAATVTFAGLSPGFVGLTIWNVTIPAGAPTGSAVELKITQAGKTSKSGVTIAVN